MTFEFELRLFWKFFSSFDYLDWIRGEVSLPKTTTWCQVLPLHPRKCIHGTGIDLWRWKFIVQKQHQSKCPHEASTSILNLFLFFRLKSSLTQISVTRLEWGHGHAIQWASDYRVSDERRCKCHSRWLEWISTICQLFYCSQSRSRSWQNPRPIYRFFAFL